MFVQVKLLKGFTESLIYEVPIELENNNLRGKVVKVPIQKRTELAFVEKEIEILKEKPNFKIRKIHSIESFPEDPTYQQFINILQWYYQIDPTILIKRTRQFLSEKKQKNYSQDNDRNYENKTITLTFEQQKVFDFLSLKIKKHEYSPTLLHGVTGSGKTEIYKKLIIETINKNQTALFLLPEITLALRFEKIFLQTLPKNVEIFSFHSGVTTSQKQNLWNALLSKKPILIIGVHLPVLLPISNLGLIIIDEEHDKGYQEKKHPKINTKEAAIIKANLNSVPILLGSATPSISSLYNVEKKGWNFFQIKERFSGKFPQIDVICMNDKKERRNFWISQKLEKAIVEKIQKKEQIIIFINRRGFSFFVQCKNCGFIFRCKSCSVSLTLHKNNWLYCHYCSLSIQYPNNCPECKAKEDQFIKKGIGTEQIVSILEKLYPNIRIEKADLDTTSKKKKWEKIVTEFQQGKIDILVGTQTITKGYHFPNVTLVGIIWADLNLHFPIFNASETSLQQLIQVAGRAGRQNDHSNVIVQSMANHEIFQYINEIDYLKFYQHEIISREHTNYPPFIRLSEIELKHINELILENESEKLIELLINNKFEKEIIILGPAKPPVSKIKNQNIRKIYIKSKNINDTIDLFAKICKKQFKSKIYFTPNTIS